MEFSETMKFSVSWQLTGKALKQMGEARYPTRFTARFEYPENHTIELGLDIEDEAPVCDVIRLQRHPERPSLNGSELRRLPLRDMITFAVAQAAHTRRASSSEGTSVWGPATEHQMAAIGPDISRRARRNSVTDDLLRDVARVYQANVEHQPREAVRETFTVSAASASRYIKLARQRGFLGPAPRAGKAGER